MLRRVRIFVGFLFVLTGTALADSGLNPRGTVGRNDTKTLSRVASMGALSRRAVGDTRMRTGVSSRAVSSQARNAISASGTRVVGSPDKSGSSGRAFVARASVPQKESPRSAARSVANVGAGMSRAATTARATAVFNDLSKIGSGYAACRESYATCMDQMCANANDTYRRCFCSDRFVKFRDIEESLDEAMIMLQQFQDNNLEAIDKTAAEVNAMYSASIGEAAIKRDTSESAKLLDNITKLLSGDGTNSVSSNMANSIGILDLDFSVDFDDVLADGGASLFDTDNKDLSTLEGTSLFNAAQRQCTRLTQNMCENNAVFTMSRSSYNILVNQDCNTYEKALNKKKETVAQAVRTVEKYLREARLEEYRAHNSMDVNECLTKVRTVMLSDTACGENYKRCLDPTGRYINPATGEPIDNYRPWFFQLDGLIKLGELGSNILTDNKDFDNFLENYRKNGYVDSQLDTCRSIADVVWNEFKRNAIIEIAQAQANKVEEVKASCIDTIAECYDAASQSIIKLGSKETAITAGALGRYVAKDTCQERVTACAALYSRGGDTCSFDSQGHLKSTVDPDKCGLTSLINYVNTVDDLTVIEKCKVAVDNYLTELCTPTDGEHEYPYNCRRMHIEKGTGTTDDTMSLEYTVEKFVKDFCKSPNAEPGDGLPDQLIAYIDTAVNNIAEDIRAELSDICEGLGGHWYEDRNDGENDLVDYYNEVWGRGSSGNADNGWGFCYQNSERIICEEYNVGRLESDYITKWDSNNEQCTFFDAWYQMKCDELGGYYEQNVCYVERL